MYKRQLLAQDQDSGQLGRMSAFFTVLGDILALFALQPDLVERYQGLCSLPAKESDLSLIHIYPINGTFCGGAAPCSTSAVDGPLHHPPDPLGIGCGLNVLKAVSGQDLLHLGRLADPHLEEQGASQPEGGFPFGGNEAVKV